MALKAIDFVVKNQFEDRGAQFFGDEAVLAGMNEKGSGGGIEQISAQLSVISKNEWLKLKTSLKRIDSVQGFQNAMMAVLQGERDAGRAIINIVDGEKVRVDNPVWKKRLLHSKFPLHKPNSLLMP